VFVNLKVKRERRGERRTIAERVNEKGGRDGPVCRRRGVSTRPPKIKTPV